MAAAPIGSLISSPLVPPSAAPWFPQLSMAPPDCEIIEFSEFRTSDLRNSNFRVSSFSSSDFVVQQFGFQIVDFSTFEFRMFNRPKLDSSNQFSEV